VRGHHHEAVLPLGRERAARVLDPQVAESALAEIGQEPVEPLVEVASLVDPLVEQERDALADQAEVVDEALVLELAVVDLAHDALEIVHRHTRGDQRAHDRSRGRPRHAMDLVPGLDQRGERADEADALYASALEHQVSVHVALPPWGSPPGPAGARASWPCRGGASRSGSACGPTSVGVRSRRPRPGDATTRRAVGSARPTWPWAGSRSCGAVSRTTRPSLRVRESP